MTNGEYIEKIIEQDEDYCIFKDYAVGTVTIEVSLEWWNKSQAESEDYKAMELKDTIDGMISDDYKERFKTEYKQLIIRLDRLNALLDKYYDDKLDFTLSRHIELLIDQRYIMERYVEVLRKRASHEGINLD